MHYHFTKILLSKIIAVIGIILFAIIFWWWIIPLNFIITHGHPFFKSTRAGKRHHPFLCLKFRTLPRHCQILPQHEYCGETTRFGRFLRKTSLDETSQLINILKGEMSFIGPRPIILSEKELLHCREKAHVDYLRPGLTGWAQLHNCGGDYKKKVEYDEWYLEHFSFKLDLKIFFLTFAKISQDI